MPSLAVRRDFFEALAIPFLLSARRQHAASDPLADEAPTGDAERTARP